MARFKRTISPSGSLPMRVPSFAFDIVVILSTIDRWVVLSPFVSLGAMVRRNSGASVGSRVKTLRIEVCGDGVAQRVVSSRNR